MNRKFKITFGLMTIALAVGSSLYAQTPGDDAFAIAQARYSRGLWQPAIAAMEQFAAQHPDHPRVADAIFYKAESLVQLQKYAEAQKAYVEYLKLAPTGSLASQAKFRQGEMAYFNNDYQHAKEVLTALLKKERAHTSREYMLPYLGRIALLQGDFELASDHYEAALSDFPEGRLADECRLGFGRALAKLGNHADALRYFKYLADTPTKRLADDAQLETAKLYLSTAEPQKASETLSIFMQLFGNSPLRREATYLQGSAMAQLDRFEEAATRFEIVAAAETKDAFTAAALFSAGQARQRLKQIEKAVAHFRTIGKEHSDSQWADDALQMEIAAAFQKNDSTTVCTLADEFAKKYPESEWLAHVNRLKARALLRKREFNQAANVLEKVVESTSQDSPASAKLKAADWYSLARANLGNGDAEAAMKAIERIDLTEASEALQAGVHVVRASALMELSRYAEAQASLESYLKLRPEGSDASRCRLQLVLAHAYQDQLEAAIAAHRVAQTKDSTDPVLPSITQFLADRCFHQKQYDNAKTLYELLTAKSNKSLYIARGHFGAAWCDFEQGEFEAAAQRFGKVVSEFGDSPHAAEAAMAQAQAYEKLGDKTKALQAFAVGADKFPEGTAGEDFLLGQARLAQQTGAYLKAAEAFAKFETAFPDSGRIDEALYQHAWSLVDANQPEQADTIFRRLAKEHTTSRYWADVMYRLAQQAVLAGEIAQARTFIAELLSAGAPANIHCHALYLQTQVSASENKWAEVAESAKTLVGKHSDHELAASARYWLAESHYRLNEHVKATTEFDALAKNIDQLQVSWAPMVQLRRAQLLGVRKDWEGALKLAETIAVQYPDFRQQYEADYLIGRCWASRAEVDFAKARQSYEKVLQSTVGAQTETAAMAQWMIGESYFHQQKYDDALVAYERVDVKFAFPRWQAAALLQQGKCYEKKNDWRSAIACYTQVLKEHADSTFAEAAAARIESARVKDNTAQKPTTKR